MVAIASHEVDEAWTAAWLRERVVFVRTDEDRAASAQNSLQGPFAECPGNLRTPSGVLNESSIWGGSALAQNAYMALTTRKELIGTWDLRRRRAAACGGAPHRGSGQRVFRRCSITSHVGVRDRQSHGNETRAL
jgi:hypothetical protein